LAVAQTGTAAATSTTTTGANNTGRTTTGFSPATPGVINGSTSANVVTSSTMGNVTTNNTVTNNAVSPNTTIATPGSNNFNNPNTQLTATGVNGLNQNFNNNNTQLNTTGVNGLNQNFNSFTDVNGQVTTNTNNGFNNQVTPVINPFGSNNPFVVNGTTLVNPFANPFNNGIVSNNMTAIALANQLLTAAAANPNFPLNFSTNNLTAQQLQQLQLMQQQQLQQQNSTRSINGAHPASLGIQNVHFQAITLGSSTIGVSAATMRSPAGVVSTRNSSTGSQGNLRIVQRPDGTFTNVSH
jgi:hypothetical protein